MWSNLNKYWKKCFELAWQSYINGSIPIAAIIVNRDGEIVSTGRNKIFEEGVLGELYGTYMAHAEMNAIVKLKEVEHPNIREYTLYTTMEPCPMCFGTILMTHLDSLVYGARDGFAGAIILKDKSEYTNNKRLKIHGPDELVEKIHIALQSAYEYERNHKRIEDVLNKWKADCEIGVKVGKVLYEEEYLINAKKSGKEISEVIDYIVNKVDILEEAIE